MDCWNFLTSSGVMSRSCPPKRPRIGALIFQFRRLGGEMPIVNDCCRQMRLGKRRIERVASAHTPSDGPDPIFFHARLRRQKVVGGAQITDSPVFGQAAHQFVRQIRIIGDFAAIQIDRQRNVSLIGKLRSLLFHQSFNPQYS